MRSLTIQRQKSVVASLATVDIYIEDPNSQEIIINNIPCRKIGELKNGEQKTFQISEERAKVFVIADKLSKSFCSEFFEIPAGIENIFLTGKNEFNPATGNAFRFENNNSVGIAEHRKKGRNLGIIICIIAIIGGYFLGRGIVSGLFGDNNSSKGNTSKPIILTPPIPDPNLDDNDDDDDNNDDDSKMFVSNGMTIILTKDFEETTLLNFTVAFASDEVYVTGLEEKFSLADGLEDYTLEEYGKAVMKNANLDPNNLKKENDLTYFTYEVEDYYYFASVYKTDEAFWLVQFMTYNDSKDYYIEKFIEWSKSIDFETIIDTEPIEGNN